MTVYLSNRDGNGKTNEEGHYRLQTKALTGFNLGVNDLKVKQNSPLGMSVLVSAGDYRLEVAAGWAYTGWIDVDTTLSISTPDPANPRITMVVLYIDKGAATSASPPNNPGVAKLMAVDGSASPTPTAPSGSAIQSAVGSGNPYYVLASVDVGAAASTITNSNITDLREKLKINPVVLDGSDVLGSANAAEIGAAIGPVMYPIGSIYINAFTNTNPATLLGFGTWVAFGSGRVMVGVDSTQTEFDTLGETGGAKTHTLTLAETPNHRHGIGHVNHGAGPGPANPDATWVGYLHHSSWGAAMPDGNAESGSYPATTSRGGGGAHNNLQPYITVYMWRRTA